MLVDTIFYFYGVKIMKNIDNKVKLDSSFKDLNFNVSELKRMYNKYNSPLKFSEFISYYEEYLYLFICQSILKLFNLFCSSRTS